MARVVLIEPFYGGSHKVWVDGWVANTRHQITLVSHPGEFWRWRLRGGAVTLAQELGDQIMGSGPPDLVVVSGMVDLAALAGLARGHLAGVPLVLYLHESQLLYPLAPGQRPDTSLDIAAWRSVLAADEVWFNSGFHRDALRAALPELLAAQPAPGHAHLVAAAFERTRVLWPGAATAALNEMPRDDSPRPPRVLWNQRWAHDKNPDVVIGALRRLAVEGVEFTVALGGEDQRTDQLEALCRDDALAGRIEPVGFLPRAPYCELLLRSDVVVSAADHEFFGIAVVEAIAAGGVPLLPNRLSYPELIEAPWQRAVLYEDGQLVERLRSVLVDLASTRRALDGLRESMRRFDLAVVTEAHDLAVDDVVAVASPHG